MITTPPETRDTPDVHKTFRAGWRHFRSDNVREAAFAAREKTKEWLKKGDQSYSPDGGLDLKKPWWPADLPETDNPIVLEERSQSFRYRLFEHGMFSFYEFLELDTPMVLDHGLYFDPPGSRTDPPTRWELIKNWVTDPATRPIVGNLIMREECEEAPLSLRKMGDMYRYSEGVKHKVRAKLMQLAPLGLISVYANGTYAIHTGVLSGIFYRTVLVPFARAYDRAPYDWKELV